MFHVTLYISCFGSLLHFSSSGEALAVTYQVSDMVLCKFH